MNEKDFDVIVVGARCAGAVTAMLLARHGYEVLVVDRDTFPSDTLSTHVIQPQGAARLAKWGLLDRIVRTGCPPIDTYAFHFGPLEIAGAPGTDDASRAFCPRRLVLDQILVDAAVEAGAEVRQGFTVDELLSSDGHVTGIRGRDARGAVTVTARVVIGADGRHSFVARSVGAESYHERPALQGGHYAYFSDVPLGGRFEVFIGDGCGAGAAETNDGLTMIVGGWPLAEYRRRKHDPDASLASLIDRLPGLRTRVQGGRRVSKTFGAATPNFFRKPYGPGWALVGDAGYLKDPITAQGMSDAFRDAELLAAAVNDWRSGTTTYDAAMARYQAQRDAASLPMYELTCQLAALEPPPPALAELLGALRGNQDAMNQFCQVNAGTMSPAVFFDEKNVGRILATARATTT